MSVQDASLPDGAAGWAEARQRFAQILGMTQELPAAVLHRAMMDSVFAHRLLVSRNAPNFLDALISDPNNAKFAPLPAEQSLPEEEQPASSSTLTLLGRAAKSLAIWGATGFTHVDEEVFSRRLNACLSCPHLREAPQTLAYRLAGTGKDEPGACGLCGCPVQRKARMSTEACPGQHPGKPGYTRWDEPRKA